jgi:hypothetical protein
MTTLNLENKSMDVIMMYLFVIAADTDPAWVSYNYEADALMPEITTGEICQREADLLMLRDGSVKTFVCHQGPKNPRHLFLPPYDWGKTWYPQQQEEACDTACLLEQSDARRRGI